MYAYIPTNAGKPCRLNWGLHNLLTLLHNVITAAAVILSFWLRTLASEETNAALLAPRTINTASISQAYATSQFHQCMLINAQRMKYITY